MFQRHGRIDKAAVEEDRTWHMHGGFAVLGGQCHSLDSEGGKIDPWQCRAAALRFALHDPAAGLRDGGKTALRQFRQQAGLAATRTAGQDDMPSASIAHSKSAIS